MMASHSCTLVESRFEEITCEFVLASFAFLEREMVPHVGNQNDILQCIVTAKFPEHPEVPSGDSGKSPVGDAVGVDDTGKFRASLVSVKRFSPGSQERANTDVDSRGGQESCDHLQNLCVARCSVIESRGVDKSYTPPVEREFVRDLDVGRTRFQAHSDP